MGWGLFILLLGVFFCFQSSLALFWNFHLHHFPIFLVVFVSYMALSGFTGGIGKIILIE
jgi:hypothetical protein